MPSDFEFRHATQEDIIAFYGGPARQSVKAWVGYVDGKIAGIGGLTITLRRPATLFVDVNEWGRKHPRYLLRACRIVLQELRDTQARALADPDEPKSCKLLARLGLRPIGNFGGFEVFQWPPLQS